MNMIRNTSARGRSHCIVMSVRSTRNRQHIIRLETRNTMSSRLIGPQFSLIEVSTQTQIQTTPSSSIQTVRQPVQRRYQGCRLLQALRIQTQACRPLGTAETRRLLFGLILPLGSQTSFLLELQVLVMEAILEYILMQLPLFERTHPPALTEAVSTLMTTQRKEAA